MAARCASEFLEDDDRRPIRTEDEEDDDNEQELDEEEDEEEYEEDDDEDDVKPKPKPKPKPKAVQWETAEVTYRLNASLRELQDRGGAAELAISGDAKDIFGCCKSGGERSSSHIAGRVELVALKNGFPCALQLRLEGFASTGAKNSFTSDGRKGNHTAFPGESFHGQNIVLAENNVPTSHAFLTKYPGKTVKNVDDDLVKLADGRYIVPVEHPVIDYFNELRAKTNKLDLDEADESPMGYYTAAPETVKVCMGRLKEAMLEGLQITDMYDGKLRVTRAFGEWMDAEESCDRISASGSTRKSIPDVKYSLLATLRYEFRDV